MDKSCSNQPKREKMSLNAPQTLCVGPLLRTLRLYNQTNQGPGSPLKSEHLFTPHLSKQSLIITPSGGRLTGAAVCRADDFSLSFPSLLWNEKTKLPMRAGRSVTAHVWLLVSTGKYELVCNRIIRCRWMNHQARENIINHQFCHHNMPVKDWRQQFILR